MKNLSYYNLTEKKLEQLCSTISDVLLASKLDTLQFGLSGELGAGKTTWMRYFLENLGYSGKVVSPTYTLLEEYNVNDINLIHVDLYRLIDPNSEQEFESLGLRERIACPSTWIFVEWAERVKSLYYSLDLILMLSFSGNQNRDINFIAKTSKGYNILSSIGKSEFP
tara:strand:+ start:458 stop:958 length:501 start_codon:yes stop_codon:yes gene_type:complete